jgi:hypothetical protein
MVITTWLAFIEIGTRLSVGISKKASKVFQTVKLNDAFPEKKKPRSSLSTPRKMA